MAGFPMPPRMKKLDDGIARPKRLRDYPRYYLEKARGFFFRLFYIIGLVWEAAPFMLICMAVLCLLDGTLPVIGAYISKDILNEVAAIRTDSFSEVAISPVVALVLKLESKFFN